MEVRERKAQTPLKEKLSDHYRKRDFTPKKKDVSKLGIAFFWGMTISLFLESVFYLIPHIFSGWNMVIFILLAIFTLFLTTINWMGMFFGSTGFVDKELSKKHFPQATETPRGWKYCPTCQVDAPPRSFHCTHCNACILKRDHHCFFSDSCIGFYNQRFFILYIVYMVWGNIWALYLQITYLNDVYPLNSFYDFFSFFPLVGIVQFLLGKFSILNAILMIQIPLCCLCLCAAVFFLLFELMLILKGVTSYESHRTGPIYDQGIGNNIRSVFGPIKTIPLQILFPLFRVDQQSDGSQWEITKTKGH